jgi:hypothetical protein
MLNTGHFVGQSIGLNLGDRVCMLLPFWSIYGQGAGWNSPQQLFFWVTPIELNDHPFAQEFFLAFLTERPW